MAHQRASDREAPAGLFAEHAVRLRHAVGATVHTSAANVADACAFAWLQLLRYRPEHDSENTLFPWLFKTAIREAIKLERQTRREASLDQLLELAGALSQCGRSLAHRDRGAQLLLEDPKLRLDRNLELLAAAQAVAVAGLRPREQRALALRGMGYRRREVAALTGDSLRSVDRQLVRARQRLRDVWHEYQDER